MNINLTMSGLIVELPRLIIIAAQEFTCSFLLTIPSNLQSDSCDELFGLMNNKPSFRNQPE